MMKLQIEHVTVLTYTQPIHEAIGEVRLRPRDDAGQQVIDFQLALDPPTPLSTVSDRFGNIIHCYSVLERHQRLSVTGTSVIATSAAPLSAAPHLLPFQWHDFTVASPYVPCTTDLRAFALAQVASQEDAESRALALMGAIFQTCTYEPGSTDISTTAEHVLAARRGVCQDFAHLLIALCRSVGLPGRYVSGYLYDPDLPPETIVASHAWAEVFLAGRGWLGLDPTHTRTTGSDYVRLAIGRDYTDAAPMRGVHQGQAHENLAVQVRVRAAKAYTLGV